MKFHAFRLARNLVGFYAKHHPLRAAALVLINLANGVLESLSLLAVVPLLVIVVGAGEAQEGGVGRIAAAFFALLGGEPTLSGAATLLAVVFAFRFFVRIALDYATAKFFVEFMQEVRLGLIRRVFAARISFLAGESSGRLADVVGNLVTQHDVSLKAAFALLARAMQILLYLGAALLISWQLSAAALGLAVAIATLLYPTARIVRSGSFAKARIMNRLGAFFVECVQSLKPMKAMALESKLSDAFVGDLDGFNRVHLRQNVAISVRSYAPETMLALVLCGGLLLWPGIAGGDIVELGVTLLIFSRIATEVNAFLARFQLLLSNEGSIALVRDMAASAEAERETGGGVVRPSFERAIDFAGATLAHGDKLVLTDVTLRFDARRFHVISGPSGVGKTSLCDSIVGFLSPRQGKVLIDGAPLETLDLTAWRRMIGYVPQDPFLFNDTVRANLAMGDAAIGDDEIRAALEAAEAVGVIEDLPEGLDTIMGERGMKVSGGQRQRLSLARALVRRPKLLILDEATSGLDPTTEDAIGATLRRLARTTTVIAITHQPSLPRHAHQVVRLSKTAAGVARLEVSTQETDATIGAAQPEAAEG